VCNEVCALRWNIGHLQKLQYQQFHRRYCASNQKLLYKTEVHADLHVVYSQVYPLRLLVLLQLYNFHSYTQVFVLEFLSLYQLRPRLIKQIKNSLSSSQCSDIICNFSTETQRFVSFSCTWIMDWTKPNFCSLKTLLICLYEPVVVLIVWCVIECAITGWSGSSCGSCERTSRWSSPAAAAAHWHWNTPVTAADNCKHAGHITNSSTSGINIIFCFYIGFR